MLRPASFKIKLLLLIKPLSFINLEERQENWVNLILNCVTYFLFSLVKKQLSRVLLELFRTFKNLI